MAEMLSKDTLILCQHVGTAGEPTQYEMQLSNDMSPMILSKKTGKRFSISWHDLINQAIAAGVDDEDGE